MLSSRFEKGDTVGLEGNAEAKGTVASVSSDGLVVTVHWHDLGNILTFIAASAVVPRADLTN